MAYLHRKVRTEQSVGLVKNNESVEEKMSKPAVYKYDLKIASREVYDARLGFEETEDEEDVESPA